MESNPTMNKLQRKDLYSLEEYARIRNDFRARVMAHKKDRKVALGPNMTLHFEDTLIMQYQIQEMLRAERIFEEDGIQEELNAYNPLIPDGHNWKVTQMIEYDDPEERRVALERLLGIEGKVYVQVAGFDKVYAIADEDLNRQTETKTSSVHFLRFELTSAMIHGLKASGALSIGSDHLAYPYKIERVPANIVQSLQQDLISTN